MKQESIRVFIYVKHEGYFLDDRVFDDVESAEEYARTQVDKKYYLGYAVVTIHAED